MVNLLETLHVEKQEPEYGPIVIDKRFLSRAPSPEIAELRERMPLLYDSKSSPVTLLCANTSTNFLGALLINSVKDEVVNAFSVNPNVLPHPVILKPIELVNGVMLHEKKAWNSVPLGITVDNVLIKYIAGKTAGVVLSGPYAGLFLETLHHKNSDISSGMAVSKIWNDDPEIKTPYAIGITTLDEKHYEPGYTIYREKREAFFSSTDYIYRPLHMSFFSLLNEAGIPVNPEEFHTSTIPNRSKI